VSDLSRFLEYAREFEVAQLTDDFDRIVPFFASDASHGVVAADPLAADDHGRERVVAGLRESVHRIDRRFDTRIPEVLDGPLVRPDGIWMRFGLTLRRQGLPDLCLEGEHLTTYDGAGAIVRIEEKMLDGCDEAARLFLERHHEVLRPVASRPAAPRAEDLPRLRDALQRTLVRAYGRAKSVQDVEAALAVCHPSFVIDTIPFGLASRDRTDTKGQLGLFFSVFPDYRADTEGIVSGEDGAAWWGRIALTFGGEFLGHAPTGARAELPAFSIFEFRDGLISCERFIFDLPGLCEGIELPLAELLGALERLRVPA
jgi:predicted ester cyclase